MAPQKGKLPQCEVCKKEAGKYRCPVDDLPYCSVVCFKSHKSAGCSSENTYKPPEPTFLPPTDDDAKEFERPIKRLKDLHWPPEPSSMFWDDPLQRDDVKPLRGFEYEALEHELIEHIYHPKTPPEGAYKARLFILIALLGIDAVVTFWYLFRELRESHRHGRRTWWIWRMVEQPHGSGSYLVTNYRPLGALLAGTTMLTFMAYAAMEYRWSFTETSQRWASAWRDAHLLPYICHGWFLGWGIFQATCVVMEGQGRKIPRWTARLTAFAYFFLTVALVSPYVVILALRENGWMDVWAQHMYAEGLLDQAAASWTGGEELSPGIAADVQKLLYLATYNASHYIGAMRGMQVAAMGSTFILNLASFILYITIRRQVNFNKRMHRPKTTNFPATVQVSIARPPLMRGSSCASMRTVDSHNHFTMPVKHNEGLGITSGMEMPESNAAASSAPPKHVGGGGPRDLKAAADIVVVLGIYLLILSSSCTAIQIGAFFVNQFQYPAINTTHVEAIRFMNLWVFGIFSLPIPFMMAYLGESLLSSYVIREDRNSQEGKQSSALVIVTENENESEIAEGYSPQVALLQCLSSIALAIFFLNHAWYYDRFDSLNFFKAGRAWKSREAFKRLMVFLYILGCPSFAIQGGFYAYIKYKVGFLPLDKSGMPVPYTFWPEHFQAYIMPLQYLNAFAWLCEVVVHLEELMFFLHLISLTPSSRPWFSSWHFKIVLAGSFISAGLLFGVIVWHTDDPLEGEAYLYLFGSGFVLLSNFVFFRVFYVFPSFLANLKNAGGTSEVVIRLKSFHELNKIRVTGRFFFGVPIIVLSIDGLTRAKTLNHSLLWTDLLLLIGLVGFGVQATCTLLIFMPRNIAREAGVIRPTISVGEVSASSEYTKGSPRGTPRKGSIPTSPSQAPLPLHRQNSIPFHHPTSHIASQQSTTFPPSSFAPTRPPRPSQRFGYPPPHAPTVVDFTVAQDESYMDPDVADQKDYKFGTGGFDSDEERSVGARGLALPTAVSFGGRGAEERRQAYVVLQGSEANGNFTSRDQSDRARNFVDEAVPPSTEWRRRPSIPAAIRHFNSPIDIV